MCPPNAVRFSRPARIHLTFYFEWGNTWPRSFQNGTTVGPNTVSEPRCLHPALPSAGKETVRINFYAFNNEAHPLLNESEVIIEKFEHLP
jgi:hypothetical protein